MRSYTGQPENMAPNKSGSRYCIVKFVSKKAIQVLIMTIYVASDIRNGVCRSRGLKEILLYLCRTIMIDLINCSVYKDLKKMAKMYVIKSIFRPDNYYLY